MRLYIFKELPPIKVEALFFGETKFSKVCPVLNPKLLILIFV